MDWIAGNRDPGSQWGKGPEALQKLLGQQMEGKEKEASLPGNTCALPLKLAAHGKWGKSSLPVTEKRQNSGAMATMVS